MTRRGYTLATALALDAALLGALTLVDVSWPSLAAGPAGLGGALACSLGAWWSARVGLRVARGMRRGLGLGAAVLMVLGGTSLSVQEPARSALGGALGVDLGAPLLAALTAALSAACFAAWWTSPLRR